MKKTTAIYYSTKTGTNYRVVSVGANYEYYEWQSIGDTWTKNKVIIEVNPNYTLLLEISVFGRHVQVKTEDMNASIKNGVFQYIQQVSN